MSSPADALTLIERNLPAWVERRQTVIAPNEACERCDEPWLDALAVIELGTVEVETASGRRLRLAEGAVVCFGLLRPLAIRNTGEGSAVIATVRRRPVQCQAPLILT